MRLKRRAAGKGFVHGPGQPVWLGKDREGKAARAGPAQADMFGQQTLNQTGVFRCGTGQCSGQMDHSHSIVPGGFEVMSYVTRLMPRTSLMIRVAVSPRKSWGKG